MTETTSTFLDINGVRIWYEITGTGEPVLQLHGSGMGHQNFSPATPILSQSFSCIDYDQRGYGQSDKPEQHYDIEVWADDAVAVLDALGIGRVHVHGISMGGMIAILMAGKYPDRIQSVVINCAAAKLGYAGQLLFQNWIDLLRLQGSGGRTLAEMVTWECNSRAYMDTPEGRASVDGTQEMLAKTEDRVFIAACQAMIDMDLRDYVGRITAPALVLGGDQDIMTPWDQGTSGAGQQWIVDHLPKGESHVLQGAAHSTVFDSTDEHCQVVADFFGRNPGAA